MSDLIAALAKCHRVTFRRGWRRSAPSVVLVGSNWRRVAFRQRQGETFEALLWRALNELMVREVEGMPKPDPAVVQRRKLRKLLHSANTRPM